LKLDYTHVCNSNIQLVKVYIVLHVLYLVLWPDYTFALTKLAATPMLEQSISTVQCGENSWASLPSVGRVCKVGGQAYTPGEAEHVSSVAKAGNVLGSRASTPR
jgi:hypothetical protein